MCLIKTFHDQLSDLVSVFSLLTAVLEVNVYYVLDYWSDKLT